MKEFYPKFVEYLHSEVQEEFKAYFKANYRYIHCYMNEKETSASTILKYMTVADICSAVIKAILHNEFIWISTNNKIQIEFIRR